MKVNVNLTVEVDPKAWALSYGEGGTAAELRKAVKEHIAGDITNSAAYNEGCITEVTIK
jgi:hypothetical protein